MQNSLPSHLWDGIDKEGGGFSQNLIYALKATL
jgi:hypothetical protein